MRGLFPLPAVDFRYGQPLSAQHSKPQPSLARGLFRLTYCAVSAGVDRPSLQSFRIQFSALIN